MDIAALFAGIANIDYHQGTRFSRLYENVVQNEVFCKPIEALWICMQCGNIMSEECAPLMCPVCDFPPRHSIHLKIQLTGFSLHTFSEACSDPGYPVTKAALFITLNNISQKLHESLHRTQP